MMALMSPRIHSWMLLQINSIIIQLFNFERLYKSELMTETCYFLFLLFSLLPATTTLLIMMRLSYFRNTVDEQLKICLRCEANIHASSSKGTVEVSGVPTHPVPVAATFTSKVSSASLVSSSMMSIEQIHALSANYRQISRCSLRR